MMTRPDLLDVRCLVVLAALASFACFDPRREGPTLDDAEDTDGDGDGDPGDGDGDPGDGDGDPGDGDGDPGDGDGAPGDGDGELEPLCGNGKLDAGELCDDGLNLGLDEGDCASDCSAAVEVRTLSVSGFAPGDLLGWLPGEGDLPERVDLMCPAGHKALFAYADQRRATLSPFAGDGQIDWPLRPWTRYERVDGTWIATTDAAALLGVRDGAWVGLDNPITAWSAPVWTGVRADYRTIGEADELCEGFGESSFGVTGWVGDAGVLDLAAGKNFLQQAPRDCHQQWQFLCAAQ